MQPECNDWFPIPLAVHRGCLYKESFYIEKLLYLVLTCARLCCAA